MGGMTTRPARTLGPDQIERLDELLAASARIARRHFYGDLADLAAADKNSVGGGDRAVDGAGDGEGAGAAAGAGVHRGYDPVTEADRAIEELLRAGITAMLPGDAVVGEENGRTGPADAERTWYLDPIDGTKAFLTGMTGWGTLVGVVSGGRAVAGWMDQPVLGETFSAVGGRALVRRPAPEGGHVQITDLRTSDCTELSEAILYTTHPSMFGDAGEDRDRYDELGRRVRLQRFGGDCYAYCMLAAGRVDLVVEADLNSYDIVALIPIIEAAGGVITGPDGRQPLEGGTVVAAATPELAEQAWAVLRAGT